MFYRKELLHLQQKDALLLLINNKIMRQNNPFARFLLMLMLCATFSGCADSDYDLSKNLDMTVGLGSEGLRMKLGTTEKIYLRDVLKVEDSDLLDTLTTGTNLYYILKKGAPTTLDVKIDPIAAFKVNDVELAPSTLFSGSDLISQAGSTTIPAIDLPSQKITASKNIDINVKNIPSEVERIRSITANKDLSFSFQIEAPAGANIVFKDIKNLKIQFPDLVASADLTNGVYAPTVSGLGSSTVTFSSITLDSLVFRSSALGQKVISNALQVSDAVSFSADVVLAIKNSFTAKTTDQVNVKLNVMVGNVTVSSITGVVNPTIEPIISDLEIGTDLPDFLQDSEVRLAITNPTIKFVMNGLSLPVPLLFSSELNSVNKDGSTIATVSLPESGSLAIAPKTNKTYYFYQDATGPWTVDGTDANNVKSQVSDLSTLVTQVPDRIKIDLGNGKVHTNTNVLHTLQVGATYKVSMDYEIAVPFQFNKDLIIVYKDSTESMNDDLKDYDADGLVVSAIAQSKVPLALSLTIIPKNAAGEEISESSLQIGSATIAPSVDGALVETPIEISLTPSKSGIIPTLDEFIFRVKAASQAKGELCSDQYLILKDIRIKLKGQIISNWN